MASKIILIAFYLITPAILIYITEKNALLNKIGAVLLAYAIGLLVGNIGVLDKVDNYAAIQEMLNNICIPLAIPLLLFSLNVKNWFKETGKAVVALLVLLFSVMVSVAAGYLLFKNQITDAWKISGMLMGVYSGGTPNLAAVQAMLSVAPDIFITVNTIDIFVSAIYLLFLMTLGKILFRKFLPAYVVPTQNGMEHNTFDESDYHGIFKTKHFKPLFKAMGLAVLIVGASAGISFLLTQGVSMLVVILSITTMALALSLNKRVNQIKYTFQTGMYFIIVFCLVVASMANIREIGMVAFDVFKYIAFVVFGSLIIKTILSKLFKIDADTLIVSSTALICSPPFVPVMAGVLKNKQIIVTGLTIGIIGYAVGNYLGVTIAYLLKML